MADRRGVDHAQAKPSRPSPTQAAGPVGQVTGQTEDVAGVADGRLGARPDASPPAVAFEERDPEPSLEFRQAL
jgi:hypothetical protein